MSKKATIILSGGLDSTVLLYYISKKLKYDEIYTLSFNYGQRLIRELECAKEQAKILGVTAHKELDLRFFRDVASNSALTNLNIDVPLSKDVIGDPQSMAYVPNRNMVFLSIATAYAESNMINDIFYGVQGADTTSGFFDGTTEFLDSMNNVLMLNRKNQIRIEAPFINWSKTDIVQEGVSLKVDFKKTHTCYNGTEIACGRCVSDANRIQAFLNAGFIDPVPYAIDIPWSQYNCIPLPY